MDIYIYGLYMGHIPSYVSNVIYICICIYIWIILDNPHLLVAQIRIYVAELHRTRAWSSPVSE